jgi:predicted metal-dependent hydrolase
MHTKTSQLEIGDYNIDVHLKNIKNMHLAVYPPTGRIRISAPLETNIETIRLFAISKIGWIKKHQTNFNNQLRQPKSEYLSGESHYLFGKRYLLNVFHANKQQYASIRNKTNIDLYVRDFNSYENRQKVITEWYRSELKLIMPDLIHKWEKIIGVSVLDWGVKRMKTKWGTCNINAKRIWLNLELVKKPVNLIEYVVVHEILHLIEKGHGKKFYELMTKYLPKWNSCKTELNKLPIGSFN